VSAGSTRLVGEPHVLIAAFPVAALVAQARGDPVAAIQLVEELDEATKDRPAKYRALPLPDLTRVCVAAGHLPSAERLLEDVTVHTARSRHCLVTAQAVVTEARGGLEAAADLYADAAERWSDYGSVPERGQALFGLGRCLVQLGRPKGATGWLRPGRSLPASPPDRYLPRPTRGFSRTFSMAMAHDQTEPPVKWVGP